VREMKDYGIRSVAVRVKGTGSGRQSVVQTIKASGIRVEEVKNVTPVSHSKGRRYWDATRARSASSAAEKVRSCS
jgi:ribosomal protein S11